MPLPAMMLTFLVHLAHLAFALLALAPLASPAPADPRAPQPPRPAALVIEPVGSAARVPFRRDAIDALIASGRYTTPTPGEHIALPDGAEKTWREPEKLDAGVLTDSKAGGGYASIIIHRDAAAVELLQASGHGMVYINGAPRTGDPYSTGFVTLPVQLAAGDNELLFQLGRSGELRYALSTPAAPVALTAEDITMPDVFIGADFQALLGAVVIRNCTAAPLEHLAIEAAIGAGKPTQTPVADLPPATILKAPFGFTVPRDADHHEPLTIRLLSTDSAEPRELGPPLKVDLHWTSPGGPQVRTFTSEIDGSVQYFSLLPAAATQDTPPALVLSLHGASVQATGQIGAMSAKTWTHIVAPTNRRPYGFDWEDWGRLDAIEALDAAGRVLEYDPSRVYLTGHSMGGHGTWQLGVLFPDRFAAIGPTAGWVDFASYAGAPRPENPTPMQNVFLRAGATSDTLSMKANLAGRGVYILHGDKDDNVPVEHARRMKSELAGIVPDLGYHEQVGAGHWWESSDEPGAECMDWPGIFDLFARRRIPAPCELRAIDFTTVNPGVSPSCAWVTVLAQVRQFEPSVVHAECDPHKGRFRVTTSNIAGLSLSPDALAAKPTSVEVDAQKLEVPAEHQGDIHVSRDGDTWRLTVEPPPERKGPRRYGTFKDAFRHRAVLVYGTGGTPEENTALLNKARYDAETFWYRGNGSFQVVSDVQWLKGDFAGRNAVVYGNADTNRAWSVLLSESPIQVHRDGVRVGEQTFADPALGCLFIRPRPGEAGTSVGVVAGCAVSGQRLLERVPYFVSGVAYPDYCVFGPEVLAKGLEGVKTAGFFDLDWRQSADRAAAGGAGATPAR